MRLLWVLASVRCDPGPGSDTSADGPTDGTDGQPGRPSGPGHGGPVLVEGAVAGPIEPEGQGLTYPPAATLQPLPRLARALNQRPSQSQLRRLPGLQRLEDVAAGRLHRLPQRPGVLGSLGSAGGGVGTSGEGGIAEQADPAEGHARYLKIEHHLDEGVVGRQQHLGEGRGERRRLLVQTSQVTLLNKTRRNGAAKALTGAGGEQIIELLSGPDVPIPQPVDQTTPQARGPTGGRDRVGKGMAVRQDRVGDRSVQGSEAPGGERLLGDGPSPRDVPGVARPHLGQQEAATGRVDAIGADEQVAAFRLPTGEPDRHPLAVLSKVDTLTAEVVMPGPQAANPRRVEGVVSRKPVAAGLLVHDIAICAQVAKPGRRRLDAVTPRQDMDDEVAKRGRVQDDADPTVLERRRRAFEDVDLTARVAQPERGTEAPERPPDHDHLRPRTLPWLPHRTLLLQPSKVRPPPGTGGTIPASASRPGWSHRRGVLRSS